MKRLVLVRHAKAQVGSSGLSDFNRKLDERGISDAKRVSNALKHVIPEIDMVCSSTATRAMTTAQLFCEQLEFDEKTIQGDAEFYDASPSFMRSFIEKIDDNHSTVLIFGHNPTQTFLIEYYSGNSIGHLPTSGVGVLEFDIDSWMNVSYNSAYLKHLIHPKSI